MKYMIRCPECRMRGINANHDLPHCRACGAEFCSRCGIAERGKDCLCLDCFERVSIMICQTLSEATTYRISAERRFGLAARAKRVNRRARTQYNQANRLTERHLKNILLGQEHLCAKCEVLFDPLAYHVDHIEALSNGGTNKPDNIQLLCPPCNLRKATA